MKLKKALVLLVIILLLPIILYRGYDFLSWRERAVIRDLCSSLKTGDKLDLGVLERRGIKLYNFSFSPTADKKLIGEKLKGANDTRKNFDRLSSNDFSDLFFLAEGFNRESLSLTVASGNLTRVKCHTNAGFVEHSNVSLDAEPFRPFRKYQNDLHCEHCPSTIRPANSETRVSRV